MQDSKWGESDEKAELDWTNKQTSEIVLLIELIVFILVSILAQGFFKLFQQLLNRWLCQDLLVPDRQRSGTRLRPFGRLQNARRTALPFFFVEANNLKKGAACCFFLFLSLLLNKKSPALNLTVNFLDGSKFLYPVKKCLHKMWTGREQLSLIEGEKLLLNNTLDAGKRRSMWVHEKSGGVQPAGQKIVTFLLNFFFKARRSAMQKQRPKSLTLFKQLLKAAPGCLIWT